MNTIYNVKNILIQYIEKERFEFQCVLTKQKAIEELVGIIQQIQMFTKSGMDAKKIMYAITGINDESIEEQLLNIQKLKQIQKQIKKFNFKEESDTYNMIYNLILTLRV